jgi:hypothetical protein
VLNYFHILTIVKFDYNMKGCLTTFTFWLLSNLTTYSYWWSPLEHFTKLNKKTHAKESLCPKLCVDMMMMCSAWQMGPCHTKEGNLQKRNQVFKKFFLVSRFVNIPKIICNEIHVCNLD